MGAEVGAISVVFNDRSSTYLVIIHTEIEETQAPLLPVVASDPNGIHTATVSFCRDSIIGF